MVLAAWLLSGCGGSSADSSSNPMGDSTKVTTSVDSSLQGTGALALASSISLVEKQPVGSPILARTGTVVYGLDTAGTVALAGNVVDGKVVYSSAGTVLAMGATVLQGIVPTATQEQLQGRVKAANGYAALVAAIQSAVLAGKNPLDQVAVRRGFDTVLASAARAAVQAQSVQPGTARVLAVAPKHAPYAYEPAVLETATFKVSIANSSSGESTFASKVYLRNTSAVFFNVALLNPTGTQIGSAAIEGAGPTIFSLNGALPVKVDKTLPGSFTVQLTIDDLRNKLELLKASLSYVSVFKSECAQSIYEIAVGKGLDIAFGVNPEDWLEKIVVDGGIDAAKSCVLPEITSAPLWAVLKSYFNITKAVGIGRLVADRLQVPRPIPDTGVCLSESERLMNCVSLITADAIKPMMPGAVQPISVLILDESGKKTLAPPYGLKIEYDNPNLFELSSSMTQIIAKTIEGTGSLKITDPATDKTFSMNVTVTNGKLEQTTYRVPANETVAIKLIDRASGMEVFRNPATFDIHLPVSKYGNFEVSTANLGGISFHANSIATPSPQSILLGEADSSSVLTVEPDSSYWAGTFNASSCTPLPDGAFQWYWSNPCYALGLVGGAYSGYFYFNDSGDRVIFGANVGGQGDGMRRILPLVWRSTDSNFAFDLKTAYSLNLGTGTVSGSGTQKTRLTVTNRTATEMSGTLVIDMTSGTFDCGAFISTACWKLVSTRATGTWVAREFAGKGPQTDMKGWDFCRDDNVGLAQMVPGEYNPYVLPGVGNSMGRCGFN